MSRSCGSCTACCEGWLKAEVNDHMMYPGKPCRHCTVAGCEIYENRPQSPCRDFKCAWLEHESLIPENLKPNECGAILMLDRDWHGWKTIRAVPAGQAMTPETLESLKALAINMKLPLIFFERLMENEEYIGQKQLGFGPPSFVQAVKTEIGPEDVMMFDVPRRTPAA